MDGEAEKAWSFAFVSVLGVYPPGILARVRKLFRTWRLAKIEKAESGKSGEVIENEGVTEG
jgi:hypothetical protein